jgi:AGZA family xanthine/uracil permease-like MFS transporter
MRQRLEQYFQFAELGTNWKTEILAGFTTYMTMAYIVFVNPAILRDAGMPFSATLIATCLSAAFGSLLMGLFARYPIALAPGMGLNAYFTYVVVKGMGVRWETALGAVFLSGVVFLLLTFAGIRQLIFAAIPHQLYAAVAGGIGLFIAFIGLRNAGIIVKDSATMVTLGSLSSPPTALAIFGLLITATLMAWHVRAAMLLGILATTAAGVLAGLAQWRPAGGSLTDLSQTAFHLDVASTLQLGALEIVFVFLFVDLFDNIGTLVAVGKKARLFTSDNQIPRLNRILLCDACATIAGSLAGTSTVVSYIESSAGVAAGGRSGLTAVVAGLLFLATIFIAPVAGAIPESATAPALIIVGSLMMASVAEIDWSDTVVAVSAFLTLITIPLTFSIANGLAFGLTGYTLLRLLRGEFRKVNIFLCLLTALLILRFVYLGRG